MSTWIVIPTYNEAENLEGLVKDLRGACPEATLLIVDDASPDGTGALAERLGESHGPLEVLHRAGKAGIASAYVEGFSRALASGAQRIVQMDADRSHDPVDVPSLLADPADLVLGSRYVPGGGTENWAWSRRTLSQGGSLYARVWLGLAFRDLTGGFKAWKRSTLAAVLEHPIRSEGYAFQVEMTWRAHGLGAAISEVPIVFSDRRVGESKMSAAIALEAAWLVPLLRFRR
jgi:dolichol-phosphate mannosyltransferase